MHKEGSHARALMRRPLFSLCMTKENRERDGAAHLPHTAPASPCNVGDLVGAGARLGLGILPGFDILTHVKESVTPCASRRGS